MAEVIQLQVVHRNRLFRECLASVLSEADRFDVVELDHTEPEPHLRIEAGQPSVLLLDASLPEPPAELIRRIRQRASGAKIVLLVHALAQDNLMECIAAGAQGCVLEDASLDELRTAIGRVVAGETFCSPELVHLLFQRLAHAGRRSEWQDRAEAVGLTPRELEIVRLIAARLSNKQIARRLSVSLYTVKNHVHNIIEKLQVADRFGVVEYARRRRWIAQPREAGAAEPVD